MTIILLDHYKPDDYKHTSPSLPDPKYSSRNCWLFFPFRAPSKTPTSKAFMGIKFCSMSRSSSDRLLHDCAHTQQKDFTHIKKKKRYKLQYMCHINRDSQRSSSHDQNLDTNEYSPSSQLIYTFCYSLIDQWFHV